MWENAKASLETSINETDFPPADLKAHFEALEKSLSDLFADKIGEPYDSTRTAEICNAGEERYKARIPPGFEDAKQKAVPDKYGDLIFRNQILDRAKAIQKPVLLVTDDRKEDWWLTVSDRQDSNQPRIIVGSHPLLIREMRTVAGQRLWMYVLSDFVSESRERLKNVEADQAVVSEIKHFEAASDNNRMLSHYNSMMELRKRLADVHRLLGGDPVAQLRSAVTLRHDLSTWWDAALAMEMQQQKLLDRMGMAGALSQIPEIIDVRSELDWLDREIVRLETAV